MKKGAVVGALVLAVALLGSWVYAGPYLALRGLKGAIEDKSPQAMYDYVDFPVFKENLKREMLKGVRQEKDNPFAELGASLVDGMVEMFVNPEMVIKLFSASAADNKESSGDDGKPDEADFAPKFDFSGTDLKMQYTGLNSFELALREQDGGEWAFVLHRRGLGWKIDDVRIDAARNTSSAPAAAAEGSVPDGMDDKSQTSGVDVEAVATALDSSAATAPDEQYCGSMYRNLTPEDMSAEAIAEFKEECPGYDLPIQWQEAEPSRDERVAQNVKPSFDCAKASTRPEQLICSDGALADLDLALASLYSGARARATDKGVLKDAQNRWRKGVRDACGDVACLKVAYEERIAHFQGL